MVTINTARQLLLEKKSVWAGLEGILLTGELAEIFNVPGGAGYLVKSVAKDSPAWNAGIQGGDRAATIGGQEIVVRGDIILAVAGIPLRTTEDFAKMRERINAMPTGQPVKVSVLRAGKVIELTGKVP